MADLDTPPPFDPNDPDEEHALRVMLMGYKFYRSESHLQITHRRRVNAYALPPAHQKLLFEPPISLLSSLSRIDDCIAANSDFLVHILGTACQAFGVPEEQIPATTATFSPTLLAEIRDQVDKVRSVLRQFVRDWSDEGFEERGVVYGRILHTLAEIWPDWKERASVKVLVPGAGLGRLALDIAGMGFWSQGNEWAYSMLAASQFVLNCTKEAKQFTIHPYVGNFTHRRSRDDQVRGVQIPDVHPSEVLGQDISNWKNPYEAVIPQTVGDEKSKIPTRPTDISDGESDPESEASSRFSMVAGDFTQCYRVPNFVDCVATCFFLDTASNPLLHIDVIHHILKPGGMWINCGPLLWHWDGKKKEGGGVELTLEELLQVVEVKFKLLKRESKVYSGYTSDTLAMGRWTYDSEYWVAQKI